MSYLSNQWRYLDNLTMYLYGVDYVCYKMVLWPCLFKVKVIACGSTGCWDMTFYIIKCIRQKLTPGCHNNTFSTQIFQEAYDMGFPKIYGRNCHPNGTGFRFGPWTITNIKTSLSSSWSIEFPCSKLESRQKWICTDSALDPFCCVFPLVSIQPEVWKRNQKLAGISSGAPSVVKLPVIFSIVASATRMAGKRPGRTWRWNKPGQWIKTPASTPL